MRCLWQYVLGNQIDYYVGELVDVVVGSIASGCMPGSIHVNIAKTIEDCKNSGR